MASQMDKDTFLNFYKDTMLGYSQNFQNYTLQLMKEKEKVSFDNQLTINESHSAEYFEKTNAIAATSSQERFARFYEYIEFHKLYKYSVPLFYEFSDGGDIAKAITLSDSILFDYEKFKPSFMIPTVLGEDAPLYIIEGSDVYIKFVVQKHYRTYEDILINYRFPIIIYFNNECKILEIRYDSPRHDPTFSRGSNKQLVIAAIKWIKDNLGINLFICEHFNLIANLKADTDGDTKIYKQMMELKSGGSAELTASADSDYILPFIGELRELISENDELFKNSPDLKALLYQYLDEKEDTTNYPYIYIKRVKPVDTDSYLVKITFDFFDSRLTLLQHITGDCKDLGRERMNDAIKYFCESSSFARGDKI